LAEATRASLKIVITENWRRDKLAKLVSQFRKGAEQLGLELMSSSSAIQPLLIGDSQKSVAISNDLLEKGFLVSAIRPPTVPQNTARLRITFSAMHEEIHIDRLLSALAEVTG
jgi:8-amino-7-oxononanoate synthase